MICVRVYCLIIADILTTIQSNILHKTSTMKFYICNYTKLVENWQKRVMSMIQKVNHETYNDGILEYGNIKSIYTEGRRKIGEEFIPKGQIFYTEMSSRDTDILQASSMGYVIDLKLKIPYRSDISSKDKVRINNDDIYDIKKFDSSKKKEIFLYLQKVGV